MLGKRKQHGPGMRGKVTKRSDSELSLEGPEHLMEEVKGAPKLRKGTQARTGGPAMPHWEPALHPRVSVPIPCSQA